MKIIIALVVIATTGVFGQNCSNKCSSECERTTKSTLVKVCGQTFKVKQGATCKFSNECPYKHWCNKGKCEPMVDVGKACKKNDECCGLSKCVPLGNGICEETCRCDSDCLQYSKDKYCTVGGTAGTQKGRCVPKLEKYEPCFRSPECKGIMYCRNGWCQESEEEVLCRLNCHAPDPRKPDSIRPGQTINITYACTFIRRAQFGHQNLKATITLNHGDVEVVKGLSPQYFSGTLTKIARKGENTAILQAVMKTCASKKDSCAATRHCILNAGQ